MGIRFSCHGCGKPLNIKTELAGRRGVCPECRIRFRIPNSDAEFSTPLEETPVASGAVSIADANGPDPQPQQVAASVPAPAVSAAPSPGAEVEPNPTVDEVAAPEIREQAAPEIREQAAPVETQPAESQGVESPIDLLSADDSSTWYVRPPSGGQYGPATSDVLKAWIAEGRVAKNALLWRDGWPQWREASEALPELAETLPGAIGKPADSVFSDGTSTKRQTTSLSNEKTSPIFPGGPLHESAGQSPLQSSVPTQFAGDAVIGATRRKRSSRRLTLVAVLATLVVGLIITLILVASTGSK